MLTNLKGSLFASGQKVTTSNPRPPTSFIIHVLVTNIKRKTRNTTLLEQFKYHRNRFKPDIL